MLPHEQGTFKAVGEPAGGTYSWTILGQTIAGQQQQFSPGSAAEFDLEVKYTVGAGEAACTATANHLLSAGDVLKVPVTAHIIKGEDKEEGTAATDQTVAGRITFSNDVWKQAGIEMELKETVTDKVDDALARMVNRANDDVTKLLQQAKPKPKVIDLYFVKRLVMPTKNVNNRGATRNEGTKDAAVVIEDDAPDRTMAHEFGHVNGLPHIKIKGEADPEKEIVSTTADNLMAYSKSTKLSCEQVKQARTIAKQIIDGLAAE